MSKRSQLEEPGSQKGFRPMYPGLSSSAEKPSASASALGLDLVLDR